MANGQEREFADLLQVLKYRNSGLWSDSPSGSVLLLSLKRGCGTPFTLTFNGIALYTSVKFLEGCWLQFCDTKREPRTEGPGWAGSVAPMETGTGVTSPLAPQLSTGSSRY